MKWYTDASEFCEKKLYGSPEIFNSLSTIFISLFPAIGLQHSIFTNYIRINILLIMIITGFTSFLYHWTGYYLFKHLDEIPMILSLWQGITSITEKYPKPMSYKLQLFNNLYFISLLGINTIPDFQFLFPIFFAMPLFTLIPLIEYIKKCAKVNITLYTGFIMCIVSGLIWTLTEMNCSSVMIFGHSIWHFGMNLGIYHIILAIEYIDLDPKKYKISHIYFIIPIVSYNCK